MKHILILVVGVLFAAAAAGGYWFMYQNIAHGVNGIAEARADADAASGRERFQRAASAFLSDTAREREELNTFVVQDADFVAAVETIEAAAKREKITTTVGSVAVDSKLRQFHEVITMTVSARGPFEGVTAFAAALESLPFASRVQSLSIEASAEKTWFLTASLEFIKRKALP
jgi:glutamine synthetase adenylyltransferase